MEPKYSLPYSQVFYSSSWVFHTVVWKTRNMNVK